MCGITGFIGLNSTKLAEKNFREFNNSLKHRGPDSNGILFFEKENFWIGNSRLSIVDQNEKANQPMYSYDKKYVISFNGEIFNYREIKKKCEVNGYNFKSNSDTEIILAAFKIWGEDCLSLFNGDWAFAIYNLENKELLLSRDRFGIRPLYYIHNSNFFCFASELKSFLKIPQFKINLNIKEINKNLIHSGKINKHENTWLENVKRLEPGTNIIFSKNKILSKKKWWRTSKNIFKNDKTYNENCENFKNILIDSIKIRLPKDHSFGINVSGGLDSSSLFCLIKNLEFEKKNNLFFSKNNKNISEQNLIEHLLKDKNDIIYNSSFTNKDIINNYEDITFTFENINHTFDGYLWFHYKKISTQNIKIVFDGFGADELLGGYDECTRILAQNHFRNKNITKGLKLKKLYEIISTKKKLKLDYSIILKLLLSKKNKNNSYFLRNYLYKIFHKDTLPNQLRRGDLASMRFGVENRLPFLDHRLVEFCFGLKDDHFIDTNKNKRILRDSMNGMLPKEISKVSQKTGFHYPTDEFINSLEFREYLLDLISSKYFVENNIFDGKKIKNLILKQIEKKINIDSRNFKFINLISMINLFKSSKIF